MTRVIRLATGDDEAELRRLWNLMSSEAAARGKSWPDFPIERIASDAYLTLVVDAGTLVGCAYVQLGSPNPAHGRANVDLDTEPSKLLTAYVAPEAAGQGIFQELMSAVSTETLKRSTSLLIDTPRDQPLFVSKRKRRFGLF